MLGVGGDPLLSLWFLNWTPFALSHHLNPLFTNYLDYPQGVNLMWNTAGPLLGLAFWPVTASWGPMVTYNLAETLGVAGSAFAAFLAIRHLSIGPWAAFAGGLLYGFSPFMMAHALGHPQLIAAFTPPLMVIALNEILVRQQRPAWQPGLMLGVLGAIQLLIWEELALSEALIGVLAIAVLATFNRQQVTARARHAGRALGIAAGACLILAAVPLAFQFFGPQQVHGSVWAPDQFVSDLLAFVTPTPLQELAPSPAVALSELFPGKVYEWSSYLGIPLVALLAYAAVRCWSKPITRVASIVGAFAALLSMGALVILAGYRTPIPVALFAFAFPPAVRRSAAPRPLVYAFLLAWGGLILVPVMNDILPSRLTIFMYLMAAILLALFIDRAIAAGRPGRTALAAALAFVALLPLLPRFPYPVTAVDAPAFFRTTALQQIPEGSVALVTPYAYDWRVALPMSWQVEAGMRFRMPEGFAWIPGPNRFQPRTALGDTIAALTAGQPVAGLTADRRRAMLADLRILRVRTVIVATSQPDDPVVVFFTNLLGRAPIEQGGVQVWLDLSR